MRSVLYFWVQRGNAALAQVRTFLAPRRVLTAVLVGIGFFAVAAIYVQPAMRPLNHGVAYSDISVNPFDFSFQSDFRLRPLTPVVAYLLGFRGPLFVYFTYLLCPVFIGLVYFTVAKKYPPAIALTAASAVAFNSPVLFQLHFSGYVDITQCILLWLVYENRSTMWSGVFAGLAVLNYPSAFFFVPWFLYLWWTSIGRSRQLMASIVIFLLFVGGYHLWEAHVFSQTTSGLNLNYYTGFSRKDVLITQELYGWLGLFMGLKLFWMVAFVGTWIQFRRGKWRSALGVALPALCAFAQLFFVTDTSRHIHLAFPSVLIGLEVLSQEAEDTGQVRLLNSALAWLVFFNFLAPQYYVGQARVCGYYSIPYNLFRSDVLGIDPWNSWR